MIAQTASYASSTAEVIFGSHNQGGERPHSSVKISHQGGSYGSGGSRNSPSPTDR